MIASTYPSVYFTSPGIQLNASLSTMSDHIGIKVLFIIIPIALVACFSFILLKLVIPLRWAKPRGRSSSETISRTTPAREDILFNRHADSWPDLERSTPVRVARPVVKQGKRGRDADTDVPTIETPKAAAVWNPSRQSRLDWTFTTRTAPSHRRL